MNGEELVKLRELGRGVDSHHVQPLRRRRVAISDGYGVAGGRFGGGGEEACGASYDV